MKKKIPDIKTVTFPFYFLQEISWYKTLEDQNNAWTWVGYTAYMVVLNNWIMYPAEWESMNTK